MASQSSTDASKVCKDGQFRQGKQCIPCINMCLTCSAKNICTSCHNKFKVQQDGSCITCPHNKYPTSAECKDCPMSYPLDSLLSQQDQKQIQANCNFPMTQDQIQDQITNTFMSSYNLITNLTQTASVKLRNQASLNFMSLVLRLLSKFQDATQFYYNHKDVYMATRPIRYGEFQIQLDRKSPFNHEVTKVNIPYTVSLLYQNQRMTVILHQQAVFGIPSIGGKQPPVLSAEVWKGSVKQKIENLSHLIRVTLYIQSTQRLKGVSYNANTSMWQSTGIETTQTYMTDGISSKLYLKAKFLGTFSVVLDDSVEEVNLRSVNIAVGVTGGLLLLLFLVALILDIMSKSRDYPHQRLSSSDNNFNQVFKHSVLYNLPIVSLFSFRDKFIPAWAKSLWLATMLVIIICLALFVYMTAPPAGNVMANSFTLSPVLAFLLIPSSLFIKVIRQRNKGKKSAKEPKQDYQYRKEGMIAFLLISLTIVTLGLVGIYSMTKGIVTDRRQYRLEKVIQTIIGSVTIGYLYGVLKSFAGTYFAMNQKKQGSCMESLFVDLLTQEAVQYFDYIKKQKKE